jgi:hypothetical protein
MVASLKKRLLWIDSIGGLSVGALMLIFHSWLSEFWGLPLLLVVFIGVVNMLYGTYSFTVARMRVRPVWRIVLLAVANFSWTINCIIMGLVFLNSATIFGLLHIFGEGLYVGILAFFEWRWCDELTQA